MGFFDTLFGIDDTKSNGFGITGNPLLDFMIMEDCLEDEEREAREWDDFDGCDEW